MAKTEKLLLDIQIKNQQALGKINRDITRLQASSFKLSTALKGAGIALAAVFATRVIKSVIDTTARFEDLNDSLASVTGSAQAGAEAFDFVTKFATKTQFSVEDLTNTYIKLTAAGITPSEKILTTFTDTAAITTDQVGSLEAVTALFSRTVQGGLGLEEIQRLEDRGVPALRIINQELGITRQDIAKFGKTAEGAAKITEAFARGIEKEFGGATAKVVDNLSTQFSNLDIALKNSANEFGQGLSPALKDVIADITTFVEDNKELIAALGRLGGTVLKGVVKLFQGLVIALGSVVKGGEKLIEWTEETREATKNLDMTLEENAEGWDRYGFHINYARGSLGKIIDPAKQAAAVFGDDLGPSIDDITRSTLGMTDALGDYKEELDSGDTGKPLAEHLKEAADEAGRVNRENAIMSRTFVKSNKATKEAKKEASQYEIALGNMLEEYSLNNIAIGTLIGSMQAFAKTTESALTDVIMGSKSLKEALGEIGQAILRELIGGIIRLVVVKPILDKIAKIFKVDLVDGVLKQANAQAKLNTELKRTIGLKLLLLLLGGAADGGPVGYGNKKGKANGGAIGYRGARAMGGNVGTGGAYLVGERGPELFVPNTAGTVVSNESMGGRMGETNVNFNITATDASSFDSMLVQRRGLITNIINDAMNRQGRRFA